MSLFSLELQGEQPEKTVATELLSVLILRVKKTRKKPGMHLLKEIDFSNFSCMFLNANNFFQFEF